MNQIAAIFPYNKGGMWMFDDPAVGLREELFVAGIDKIMDVMTKHIPNAKDGFRLMFSADPFPGHNTVLQWIEKDQATHYPATKWMKKTFIPAVQRGDWYVHPETGMEGWLCPALLKYFDTAPKHIYVALEEDPDVASRIKERSRFTGFVPSGWPSDGLNDDDVPGVRPNGTSSDPRPGWWSRARGFGAMD